MNSFEASKGHEIRYQSGNVIRQDGLRWNISRKQEMGVHFTDTNRHGCTVCKRSSVNRADLIKVFSPLALDVTYRPIPKPYCRFLSLTFPVIHGRICNLDFWTKQNDLQETEKVRSPMVFTSHQLKHRYSMKLPISSRSVKSAKLPTFVTFRTFVRLQNSIKFRSPWKCYSVKSRISRISIDFRDI